MQWGEINSEAALLDIVYRLNEYSKVEEDQVGTYLPTYVRTSAVQTDT